MSPQALRKLYLNMPRRSAVKRDAAKALKGSNPELAAELEVRDP